MSGAQDDFSDAARHPREGVLQQVGVGDDALDATVTLAPCELGRPPLDLDLEVLEAGGGLCVESNKAVLSFGHVLGQSQQRSPGWLAAVT